MVSLADVDKRDQLVQGTCKVTEMHLVAFNIDRMHGRFNLAPGETHYGILLDYLSETEVTDFSNIAAFVLRRPCCWLHAPCGGKSS